jgi:hypothetical protein
MPRHEIPNPETQEPGIAPNPSYRLRAHTLSLKNLNAYIGELIISADGFTIPKEQIEKLTKQWQNALEKHNEVEKEKEPLVNKQIRIESIDRTMINTDAYVAAAEKNKQELERVDFIIDSTNDLLPGKFQQPHDTHRSGGGISEG